MFKQKIAFGSALLALILAAPAGAQMGGMMGRAPQPRGFFNPVVGSGAVYEITSSGRDGQKTITTEVDVVGKESVDGKDGYWFESTVSNTQMGGDIVMKMLIVPDPNSTGPAKMIMQMPGRPPMEMPMQMGRMGNQKPQSTDIRSEADDLGVETITTPAGTFETHHYKMKDQTGDSWISEKVAPYGLIKHQGKDSTMILTKVVTDAKDKITGTPVPFNPMAMGMGGGGPQH